SEVTAASRKAIEARPKQARSGQRVRSYRVATAGRRSRRDKSRRTAPTRLGDRPALIDWRPSRGTATDRGDPSAGRPGAGPGREPARGSPAPRWPGPPAAPTGPGGDGRSLSAPPGRSAPGSPPGRGAGARAPAAGLVATASLT